MFRHFSDGLKKCLNIHVKPHEMESFSFILEIWKKKIEIVKKLQSSWIVSKTNT